MLKSTLILLCISILLMACKEHRGDFRFSKAMEKFKSGNAQSLPSRTFLWAGDFSEGFAPVKINEKFGYIDTSGGIVMEPRYSVAGGFSENRAPVLFEGKWGYLDVTGNMRIEARYDWAGTFNQGR